MLEEDYYSYAEAAVESIDGSLVGEDGAERLENSRSGLRWI